MIITVVCDVLGAENNGTTVASMNLIRFLKQKGHDVRVLCADDRRNGEKGFYVVPNKNFGPFNKFLDKVGVKLAKPNEEVVKRAISGAHHVHVMLPFALGKTALKEAKKQGISTTAGFHMQAENFTSYIKMNKLKLLNKAVYKYVYKRFYSLVDAIHYPTRFIRDVFEKSANVKTYGYVISNGVNLHAKKEYCARPNEYNDKTVILTIGRYSREKSQDTLIKAIRLSKHASDIQLILAGQGIKEKRYRRLSKKLPIAPEFKLYSREEIIDVINYSDLYVHPAEAELEGIACLEAIACGKLTVVSNSKLSATKDFAVDDRCVFKCRNSKDLAKIIDYWIDNPREKQLVEKKYRSVGATLNVNECMSEMERMIIKVHDDVTRAKTVTV